MAPTIYAHRGAAAELPENTLPAFQRALDVGADALELDVHATRDGVIVATHDPDGLRCCGVARAVREADWSEVARWDAGAGFTDASGARPHAGCGICVPRLVDVIRAFPGVPLNVDLKADVPDLAVELLRRERAEERTTLTSFRASTVRRVRALGYAGPTGLARNEVARLLGLPTWLQRGPLRPAGNAAQLPLRFSTRAVVERCHALGLRVDFWTANDAETARRLAALGADGIMTDDPRTVVRAVKGL
jgi:glycerophosphoryl diester phosphodiesterase